jgi:hypothetical protein
MPSDPLPGQLTLGGRVGEDAADGGGDLLIPVWFTESGLLFANTRLSLGDDSEEELNLGLGYRRLFPAVDLILGGNLYWDSRWSAHNNRFDQVGAGVELLSRWLDVRANYYWPEEARDVTDTTTRETVVGQSSASTTRGPIPTGHTFQQRTITRTTTTTRRETYETFETTLEGYDVEAGVWLPMPANAPTEIGLFCGYYNFKATEGSFDTDGWRGRLEIRARPGLILDAQWMDDDTLDGTDYYVGGRIQLPFEIGNIARGRNPFEGAGESLGSARRPFSQRLVENVIRDPQVRLAEDTEKVADELFTTTRSSSRSQILLRDVQFVNNAAPGGKQKGTAEHPFHAIQDGVNAATSNTVYVFAGKAPYPENVLVTTPGLKLFGQGQPLVFKNGTSFGGDAYPVVDGQVNGVNGPAFRISAPQVVLQGFEVVHSPGGVNPGNVDALFGTHVVDRVGVLAENATHLAVIGNRFHHNSDGLLFLAKPPLPTDGDPVELDFHFNQAYHNSGDGLGIEIRQDVDEFVSRQNFELRADGNTLVENAGMGFSASVQDLGPTLLSFSNSTFAWNGSHGLFADLKSSEQDVQLVYVQSHDNLGGGILISATGKLSTLLQLGDVQANNNLGGPGLWLSAAGEQIIGARVFLNRVNASENAGGGLRVDLERTSMLDRNLVVLQHVEASGNAGGDGVAVVIRDYGGMPKSIIQVSNLVARGNAGSGLLIMVTNAATTGPPDAQVEIQDLVAANNGQHGLDLTLFSEEVSFFISTSVLASNGVSGMDLSFEYAALFEARVAFTSVRDNGFDGVRLAAETVSGPLVLDFGGGAMGSPGQNTFTGNGGLGLNNLNSNTATIAAQFNFWGQVPPVANVDYSDPGVDAANHLAADPNP